MQQKTTPDETPAARHEPQPPASYRLEFSQAYFDEHATVAVPELGPSFRLHIRARTDFELRDLGARLGMDPNAEVTHEARYQTAAEFVTGWENLLTREGNAVPFNAENLRRLVGKDLAWLALLRAISAAFVEVREQAEKN